MKAANSLAAKVMGDILAEGMSLSGFDVGEQVKTEAVCALDEIRNVMYSKNTDEHGKICAIKSIMDRYNIKRTGR